MTDQAAKRIENIEKKLTTLRSLSNALHTAANEALTEIAEIKTMQQSPEKHKRRNLKEESLDHYEMDMAKGRITKPLALRKTLKKS